MARPPLKFAAFGILPTLGVVRLKRTISHRDARNFILDNGGMLSNKYKMTFFVGAIKHDSDPIVDMHRVLRKLGR